MLDIIIIVIAYLIGNISTSFIIAKLMANVDIRSVGSGNAGSTNVLRTLGKKAAAITFLGDSLKGVAAVLIARFFGDHEYIQLFAGISVVIGHNWPAFLKFKGGKGIATTIGVVLAINYLVALICIAFGIIILIRSKYVSLASISAITIFPIFLFFHSTEYFVFGLSLCILAIYRHRENIERLLKGTERKIGEKSGVR